MVDEPFLTLYCDPGEDFGWCVGKGMRLLAGGTEKMWLFAHQVWDKLIDPAADDPANPLSQDWACREGVDTALMQLPIERIVCENFRIYPDEARAGALDWDEVRTARVIGGLTLLCQRYEIPFITQPASIKPQAVAAGAEELYCRPLTENRHQNDAIQHFVYFTNTELLGLAMPTFDRKSAHE